MKSILILLLLFTAAVRAQLDVRMEVERGNYISYEPIQATVTVTNTSGADIVLGGPNGTPWLNFMINYDNGKPVTALANTNAQPMMCRAGETISRRFNLPRFFHLIESGGYVAKASIYFADLSRWVNSRPIRFTINQAPRPRWEKVVALPANHRMAGKYRRYQIFYFNDIQRSYIYARVIDETSGAIIQTQPLSFVESDRTFQPAIDIEQNLHVLYLGSPQVWIHQVINPDGGIVSQQFRKQTRGEVTLVSQKNGRFALAGGMPYDPGEKPKTTGPASSVRRLSDRPRGID
jgi:hypothetical protein